MRTRYAYINGVRHRTGFSRVLPPIASDTNESFERRMETLALRLIEDGHTVQLDFELKKDALVSCIVDVMLAAPEPAPIALDSRSVGERRGCRGGKKAA